MEIGNSIINFDSKTLQRRIYETNEKELYDPDTYNDELYNKEAKFFHHDIVVLHFAIGMQFKNAI